jgi:SAM-dependent methyltransferase
MSQLDVNRTRTLLQAFDFQRLFIEELGWSRPAAAAPWRITTETVTATATEIANLGGAGVFEVTTADGQIPDVRERTAIQKEVEQRRRENLLVFVDAPRRQSLWQWSKREGGKAHRRDHYFNRDQPGDLFLSKLAALVVDISELDANGDISIAKVAERLRQALDVERVTKRFYDEYRAQHLAFVEHISGIPDERDRRWYGSVLLNRLMFVYFLQKKGFVDRGERQYLRRRLEQSQATGSDLYFRGFLQALFFEGFAKPPEERSAATRALVGEIRYLNGGLFLPHRIEEQHRGIAIPDVAFAGLLDLFDRYSWSLDDTPGGRDDEINPDVLGYIFEKYINQKAFGAYYTRPEITGYLAEQTIYRLILERVNDGASEAHGPRRRFDSMSELLLGLDANLAKRLLEVLRELSVLDPACGSGAFLVAALKTLVNVYAGVVGRIDFLGDHNLRQWLAEAKRKHPSVPYFLKKQIITDNLFGVDIMEEATEIAKLRLFLTLVASAHTVEELEPLPNIDFNILCGNSLVGLLVVDADAFDHSKPQGSLFDKTYRQLLDDKNRAVEIYRHAAGYAEDLRALRAGVETVRREALPVLDDMLLGQFSQLGIKYEEATWDTKANAEGKVKKRAINYDDVRTLRPFHWGYEFDRVLAAGGFDVILTNPPWEAWKPQAKEFFARHSDLVTKNLMSIKDFEKEQAKLLRDPEIRRAWLAYLSEYPHVSAYFRAAPQFPNQIAMVKGADGKEKKAGTDVNLYKLFLEQCFNLLREGGRCGILVPTNVYTDLGTSQLRRMLFTRTRVDTLIGLSNEKYIFEGVHHSFRVCLLVFEAGGETSGFQASFRINPREAVGPRELETFLEDRNQHLHLAYRDILQLSPHSLAIDQFSSHSELALILKIAQFPRLGEDGWNLRLVQELHMTNDSDLFQSEQAATSVPLVQGNSLHQFDAFYAAPKYFIDERLGRARVLKRESESGQLLGYQRYRVVHRRIARNTDTRTMIAAICPPGRFCADTAQAVRSELDPSTALYLVALLNSFVLDFLVRGRVTAHVDMHFVYALSAPPPGTEPGVERRLVAAAARLTCSRPEFAALWREAGFGGRIEGGREGTEAERLRAEIDGLVAHLYGLTEHEFAHILSTFPVVPQATKDAALDAYRRLAPKTEDPELRALLLAGESHRLELKSTLRWDLREGKRSDAVEKAIVKTVAGFLNGDGGTLLIGVADDTSAVGLEHDYATLKKSDRDGFGLFLGDLLFGQLGKDLAPHIQWSFAELAGKDICRVELAPSPRAVLVREGTDEIFWLRAGNSTRRLTTSEVLAHQRSRHAPQPAAHPTVPATTAVPPPAAPPPIPPAPSASAKGQLPIAPAAPASEPARREPATAPDEIDANDVMCALRDVLDASPGSSLDREACLRALARALGFQRLGPRLRETLEGHLLAAARRNVATTRDAQVTLATRTITDYDPAALESQLLAALGTAWLDRDEALRAFARRLGFRRTGKRIREALEDAIKAAASRGRVEVDGDQLRRGR